MNHNELLQELCKLKELKDNWYSVAGVTEEIKHAAEHTTHRTRRVREAARESGYSLNTLSRMVAVKVFWDSIREQMPELQQNRDPNSLSFPSLEIVKRMYQANREEGEKLLIEVTKGEITFRDLRNRYSELMAQNLERASSRQVAHYAGRDFEENVFDSVVAGASELFADVQLESDKHLIFKRERQEELPIDVVGYINDDSTMRGPVVGILFGPRTDNFDMTSLSMLQYRVMFASNFLRRLWVIFSPLVTEKTLIALSSIFDELDFPSVGIAVLNTNGLKVLRPPSGDPKIDWSGKLSRYKLLRKSMTSSKRTK